MVTLGIDLLRRENSCSSFCAAFVGWKLVGLLANLSLGIVGEDEVTGGREVVRKETLVGVLTGDSEAVTDFCRCMCVCACVCVCVLKNGIHYS